MLVILGLIAALYRYVLLVHLLCDLVHPKATFVAEEVKLFGGRVHALLLKRKSIELVLGNVVHLLVAGRKELRIDVVEDGTGMRGRRVGAAHHHLLYQVLLEAVRNRLVLHDSHSSVPL